MSIEFQCGQCGKTLRTHDDTAGKRAKCPKRGGVTLVPDAPPADEFGLSPMQPAGMAWDESDLASNPYRAPESQTQPARPMVREVGVGPTSVEISKIWGRAWDVFKGNVGICLGAMLVPILIQFGVGIVLAFLKPLIRQGGGRGAAISFQLGLQIATSLFGMYIGVGQRAIMLNLAKGREAKIGELFAPPLLALKVIAGWLLMGIAFLLTAITIVGPFIIALMFWPFTYIVIERDAGVGDAIREAYETTRGHRLSVLGLALATWVVVIMGTLLTCGLGGFVAIPFSMLVFPVTYLALSGRGGGSVRR